MYQMSSDHVKSTKSEKSLSKATRHSGTENALYQATETNIVNEVMYDTPETRRPKSLDLSWCTCGKKCSVVWITGCEWSSSHQPTKPWGRVCMAENGVRIGGALKLVFNGVASRICGGANSDEPLFR
jgi:hypothetical protein